MGSLGPTKPLALWIVQLLFPVICIAIYTLSQIILVLRTLDDRWPLGDIAFGVGAFVAACVLMFGFSAEICSGVKHYIDGTFFGTLCLLFAVMMVYKCEYKWYRQFAVQFLTTSWYLDWDSITKEDLEFSVGSKQSVWEVKDPLLGASDVDVVAPGSLSTHDSYTRNNTSTGKLMPTNYGAGNGKGPGGYPPGGHGFNSPY